jgi:hypothetical protein
LCECDEGGSIRGKSNSAAPGLGYMYILFLLNHVPGGERIIIITRKATSDRVPSPSLTPLLIALDWPSLGLRRRCPGPARGCVDWRFGEPASPGGSGDSTGSGRACDRVLFRHRQREREIHTSRWNRTGEPQSIPK